MEGLGDNGRQTKALFQDLFLGQSPRLWLGRNPAEEAEMGAPVVLVRTEVDRSLHRAAVDFESISGAHLVPSNRRPGASPASPTPVMPSVIRTKAAESNTRVAWPHPLPEEARYGGRRTTEVHRFHSRSIRRSHRQAGNHCRGPHTKPGLLFHYVVATDEGVEITDIWTTREGFEKFAQEEIAPVTQEVGISPPTSIEFIEVHNYNTAG